MFPHPFILLTLAQTRHDELVASPRLRRQLARRERHGLSGVTMHFAHREADGLTVDLYWTHGELEDAFRVDVVDRRSDTHFSLHPATGREAVDAYHHPYFALTGTTGGLAGASGGARA
jgi:hypothetical protein